MHFGLRKVPCGWADDVQAIFDWEEVSGILKIIQRLTDEWESFDDDIIARVVVVIYGCAALLFPPLDGYQDDDVASKIALVRKCTAFHGGVEHWLLAQVEVALEEWSNSELKLFCNLIEISERMDFKIRGAKSVIANSKDRWPKAWQLFCQRVHWSNANSHNTSLAVLRSLNYLAVRWGEFKDMVDVEMEIESDTG